MDEDDDRASALATAIMSAATYRELRDAATETAELLVDPPEPLPAFDAGIRAIYRRLMAEHRCNERLRSRLRALLAD